MKARSEKPWLASIESPVVRIGETSVSGPIGAQHFQHLSGRAGQTTSDFLAHAHQTPFRTANPNFSHAAARPVKKKNTTMRSPVMHRLKGCEDEDLHDLILDTRHSARLPISIRSHRDDKSELNSARSSQSSSLRATYSSLSEVRKRGLLLLDLRDHISTRASIPASLVPSSQTLHSYRRAHLKPVIHNPSVMQFLNRFERKPVAKVAKMGRRGFQGQKLTHRSAKPHATADGLSSSDEADTYVEYFTLKSVP